MTAIAACPFLKVAIEGREQRRPVGREIAECYLDAVDKLSATETEPLEPVFLIGQPHPLDNQSDGARRTLRRMAQMRRRQENHALSS